ncbi:hypothetical protein OHA40_30900 [Nocardia sp. NBC_00508]|nr:hypothetical protein [Nocardia sp. NBC_00508]WUD65940.1 hypothetical protein OHA40_30900 [Nocardia sp. NBC_00508]
MTDDTFTICRARERRGLSTDATKTATPLENTAAQPEYVHLDE